VSVEDGITSQNEQLPTLRIGDCVRNPLPALRSRPVDVGTPDHVDRPS
jgi:hypothetical protein